MMRFKGGLALALAVMLLAVARSATAAAEAEELPDLLPLNSPEAFEDAIEKQTGPALVEFMVFSEECKQCIELLPIFQKVAANLKGIATVATVNCGDPNAAKVCRAYGATSFPRVLLFKPGIQVNPYTGGGMKEHEQYAGAGTPKALAAAVTDLLDDSLITKISGSSEQEAFVAKQPQLAKVLLFTDKPATTVLYKALSWAYQRRLAFAELRPDQQQAGLAEQYEVTAFPALLVVQPDGSRERYSGALKASPLREFLDSFAAKEALPDAGADAGGGAAGPDSLDAVVVHSLAAANLSDIEDNEDMWLVAFYSASGDQPSCAPQLEQLHARVQEVQGIVSFGSVNAAAAGIAVEALLRYGVDAAALESDGCALQLVLFPHGDDRDGTLRWSGGLDNAKALQDWILEQVPDTTSQLSTDLEASAFVQATGAGQQGTAGKVFLFSTKQEAPAIYKALALHFSGKARLLFGWVPPGAAAPALMQKMHVAKAPGMAILVPVIARPGAPPPKEGDMMIQPYFGQLKFQKMLGWLTALSHLAGLAEGGPSPFGDAAAAAADPASPASSGPSAEDLAITSASQLQSACYAKAGLCMILLHDGRADGASGHIDTIRAVASELAGSPVHWVAVDVSRQPSFRHALGYESLEQLPGLVALSTRRLRFAQAASPFSAAAAKQLVNKVLAGAAVTLPLQELPSLVEGGEAEVEEDAVAVQEEELDLADIMGEELAVHMPSKEELLQQAEKEMEEEQQRKAAEASKKAKKKKKKSKKSKKKSNKKAAKKKDEL